MPIELNITTEGERVNATATGEIVEQCTGTYEGLKLNKSKVEQALQDLHYKSDFNNFYLSGYTKTLTPESDEIEIVSEKVEPLIVARDTLSNVTTNEIGTFTTNLTHTVTNTVALTWSSSDQITKGFEIGCDLKISGSAHMNFTSTTGTDLQRTKSVVVGANRGVSVQLGPGKKVLACLRVNRRVLTLRIPYRVDIGGSVVGCYGTNRTKTFDMKDVLEAAGKRSSRRFTATVVIDCFTDARVELKDA